MRYGMLIDLAKCTICQSCTVVCKSENNVPVGTFWQKVLVRAEGRYPNMKTVALPMPCMHCDEAPCVGVCPVTATYKRADGLVIQDYDKCIGCKYCMVACPYDARSYNWEVPFRDGQPAYLNPDVPLRQAGVVEKCTFCAHRLDAGVKQTACAESCPARAIVFGDLDDPASEVSNLIRVRRARPMHPEFKTKPRVFYAGLPANLGGDA